MRWSWLAEMSAQKWKNPRRCSLWPIFFSSPLFPAAITSEVHSTSEGAFKVVAGTSSAHTCTLKTHPKAGCFWQVTRWVPIPNAVMACSCEGQGQKKIKFFEKVMHDLKGVRSGNCRFSTGMETMASKTHNASELRWKINRHLEPKLNPMISGFQMKPWTQTNIVETIKACFRYKRLLKTVSLKISGHFTNLKIRRILKSVSVATVLS